MSVGGLREALRESLCVPSGRMMIEADRGSPRRDAIVILETLSERKAA
jgi:hypothetical protein